ncbi:hypothetical protein [Streptomyces sp. NEAU-S7GS2]|uniref:hypothetical protein n=1 Tax=Streptomyces sp. NEAU-S7GS2 TaxID=2202000 RepID=UPI001EF5DDD0|nr:hypothetical protein [Streptomyces sp. NEAU-S7GS2]
MKNERPLLVPGGYRPDWVSTKLRWSLTVDRAERDTLRQLAAGCESTNVEFERV